MISMYVQTGIFINSHSVILVKHANTKANLDPLLVLVLVLDFHQLLDLTFELCLPMSKPWWHS